MDNPNAFQVMVTEDPRELRPVYVGKAKYAPGQQEVARCPANIVGITTDEKTWRKLALSWGVTPKMSDAFDSTDVLFYSAKKIAKDTLSLTSGDRLVITGGITNGISGNTNLIKVDKF